MTVTLFAAVGAEGAFGVAPVAHRFAQGMGYSSCRTVRTVMPENWDTYEVHARFQAGNAAEDFGEEDPNQYQTKGYVRISPGLDQTDQNAVCCGTQPPGACGTTRPECPRELGWLLGGWGVLEVAVSALHLETCGCCEARTVQGVL